ncbi:hypothetical protein [Spirillospora albida]|uniref:hypothetical protein n=1 Tax=Spirillospora albida TaxID=58123 RepID=UPI0004C04C78|nr:hypothetical protein [Spirillospora albida]
MLNPRADGIELKEAGLIRTCTDKPLSGVAVGGTFRQPQVAVPAALGPNGEIRCPAAGFKVTRSLGTVIPRPAD